MPNISVIIPTYNRKGMLSLAIQSVLNQTHEDFEIIVVDDASTDGTRGALDKFDDERLRYVQHRENRGRAIARNTGIELSRGTLIAFVDDDDEYLPDKLKRQLEILQTSQPGVGLVYTGILFVDEAGRIIRRRTPLGNHWSKSYWRGLSHRDPIYMTPLVKKKCFQEVGLFDEDSHGLEEQDMWLRISDRYTFAFVKAPLYKVRKYYGRGVHNPERKVEGLKHLYQKHSFRIESLPQDIRRKLWFQYYCRLARILWAGNHTQEARSKLIEAIKLEPFSVEGYKWFIFCLLDRRVVKALSSLLRWGRVMKSKGDIGTE
jgi:glycosyltransferase involved in cell wall biosynthesis